jgi:predicted DNA binding CopG/RHH family protein
LPAEPRAGLGASKPRRPHPAIPETSTDRGDDATAQTAERMLSDRELVMLSVRVSASLRRRLKLAAASSGRPVQTLAAEALETVCQQHGM